MLSIDIAAEIPATKPYMDRIYIGEVEKYEFDFSAWAEDNANLTSVAWSIEEGEGSIANEALTSNVASATISKSQEGKCLVSITGTAGTQTKKVYLSIKAYDPTGDINDYV